MDSRTYYYTRVSSKEQNLDCQIAAGRDAQSKKERKQVSLFPLENA
jgi:DNA invertase Pin-like site-specific DNA recombinase